MVLLVRHVAVDGDDRTVGHRGKVGVLLGEHGQGFDVDALIVGEFVALVPHLVFQVGQVLEVVGVQGTVVQGRVREHVVVELRDLDLDPGLRRQVVADVFEEESDAGSAVQPQQRRAERARERPRENALLHLQPHEQQAPLRDRKSVV